MTRGADAGGHEDIDPPLTLRIQGQCGRSRLEGRVGFVRAGIDEHAPGPLANWTLDRKAVPYPAGRTSSVIAELAMQLGALKSTARARSMSAVWIATGYRAGARL
jgi:hypothetical protein